MARQRWTSPRSKRGGGATSASRREHQTRARPTAAFTIVVKRGDLTAGPEIVVLDASGGEPWSNRAVVGLGAEPAPEEGAHGIAVVAEIANYAAEPVRGLGIPLRLDGNEVARGFVDVPAGGRARKLRPLPTPSRACSRTRPRSIDHDGFALDDRRACRVEASRGLRVLLVDGDPRTVRNEDELFFLEAALRPGDSNFSVTTVLPDDLTNRDLATYGAVFLANVARPNATAAAAIKRYVENGGGLFIAVGDRVDADAWNQTMKAVLPQPLGLKRSASALPGTRPEGETVDLRPAERLAPIHCRHPLLAALPRARRGSGVGALLPVPAARTASRGAGPPHRAALRERLARARRRGGGPRAGPAADDVGRLRMDGPADPARLPAADPGGGAVPRGGAVGRRDRDGHGRRQARDCPRRRRPAHRGRQAERRIALARAPPPTRASSEPRHVVMFEETDEPGLYRVRAARADGTVDDRPDAAFAVTLDASESDPARLADDKRPDRASGRGAGGPAPRRRLELWHALGAAAIALVLFESLLTLRFRRGRVKT